MKPTLNIVIPSRTQKKQAAFLQQAVKSVCNQTIFDQFNTTFLVGVDKENFIDLGFLDVPNAICIEAATKSQAGALNAALGRVGQGYVAFLEDDDCWDPRFLSVAMKALETVDFVSSTQLEFDEHEQILRINDFPTPSGWIMPVSTLLAVGKFNEKYQFHLDSEWLGRLSEAGIARLHLAECTAPIHFLQQVRPLLFNVINLSGGHCDIFRHDSPYPLIRRLVHQGSGMARIMADSLLQEISSREHQSLLDRFGRLPC